MSVGSYGKFWTRLVTCLAFGCIGIVGTSVASAFQQPAQQREQATAPSQQLSAEETRRLAQLGGQQVPIQPTRPAPPSAEEQAHIEQVLDYWQQQTESFEVYKCGFERYIYDAGVVGHRDETTGNLSAASVAVGEIRYAASDKASYETTVLYKFAGPGKQYEVIEDPTLAEKWVTDGEGIYEFDFQAKRLYETKLDASMKGAAGLQNSPIPFLFGARKDQILERYWVRAVTPQGVTDEIWLEAWPKRTADAQNYLKVEIILDQQAFLPNAIHMYLPQYNPKKGNLSSVYIKFKDQQVNNQLAKIGNFFKVFVRPTTPMGWKRVPKQQLQGQSVGALPSDTNRK
jgi:TIGR03009 family protein